ncbi:LysR substrate-binding domain-containing protein [Shewanella sp. UCD-KL12]|uniref:LysR substrate-binding domain-containing protein n=1 Tax=Shewanella sp. UCD-KL12 TaxID=1917163 RepID=UPI0009707813|nr:LysR substrate-binding domain-containing protein [Shewanella sp. UCD-KL12]
MQRNPITIEVLQILDAIERRGSFAKAAEEMNKATSAVSYAVQKLEEQLDIALFQRQGRRSVLTPSGQLILDEGREIVQATTRLASKAKEVATGWETHISIAIESLKPYPVFFTVLNDFLKEHPSIEIDVSESVLNGGWEALEQDKADLIVGSPGPVPLQKGYRAIPLASVDLLPVIASHHEFADLIVQPENIEMLLPKVRRVITHDTSVTDIRRSAGLSNEGRRFYVQTIDQKLEAILAGIGIGHLPRLRVQQYIDNGQLRQLPLIEGPVWDNFIAWKISNKGKGLQALTQKIIAELG